MQKGIASGWRRRAARRPAAATQSTAVPAVAKLEWARCSPMQDQSPPAKSPTQKAAAKGPWESLTALSRASRAGRRPRTSPTTSTLALLMLAAGQGPEREGSLNATGSPSTWRWRRSCARVTGLWGAGRPGALSVWAGLLLGCGSGSALHRPIPTDDAFPLVALAKTRHWRAPAPRVKANLGVLILEGGCHPVRLLVVSSGRTRGSVGCSCFSGAHARPTDSSPSPAPT